MTPTGPVFRKTKLRVRLPYALRAFWLGSLMTFGLMFLVAWLESRGGAPRNTWHPLAEPLFGDLLEYQSSFRLLHQALFFRNSAYPSVAYPPFGVVVYALFYASHFPVALYLILTGGSLAGTLWYVRRALILYGLGTLTATLFPVTLALVSFPIAGLIQRGNLELIVWILAASGSLLWLRDRDDAAAVFWGFAGAIKLYPLILLILLLPRRKFRAFFLGIGSFLMVSWVSLIYLGPGVLVAFKGSVRNVLGYQGLRAAEWTMHELATNHSLFGLVRVVAAVFGFPINGLSLPYYVVAGLAMALVFFLRIRKMPVANQLLTITVFMLMFPTVSYFYTLVHLYTPWLLLIFLYLRTTRAGTRIEGLATTILLFLPLFASYTLFTFRPFLIFGGLVQAVMLLILFLRGVQFPFAGTWDRGVRGS